MKIFDVKFTNRIEKKQEQDIWFLIDTHTGALFSQSRTGIITFQNADGNKWLYTDTTINWETDIAHFVTHLENGTTNFEGILRVFDNKEEILKKAYNYFSRFIMKDKSCIKIHDWTIFLN